jgi:hypothetical protein
MTAEPEVFNLNNVILKREQHYLNGPGTESLDERNNQGCYQSGKRRILNT